jgi:hypothetical protein
MIGVEDRQLLTPPRFVFAKCIDSPPNRCHRLAKIQVKPFHKTRVDPPAAFGQDRRDGLCRSEDDAMFDTHDSPTPIRFDDLSIEEPRLRHPTRLGPTPSAQATLGLHPPTVVRDERGHVLAKSVGEQ